VALADSQKIEIADASGFRPAAYLVARPRGENVGA
jgi:hypothetical protein